jgi:hypothetical protein
MATGFKQDAQSNVKNYETIFEKIQQLTEGEEKTWTWYRREVKKIALTYKKQPQKFIREERSDRSQDEELQDVNELRRYARQGRLFLFEYKAKMKYLPYYDQFPLVYTIAANKDHFIGANLHYLHPKRRVYVIKDLLRGKINVPKKCIHKYITDHVDGFLLDLGSDEWDSAIALPVERFVKERNGQSFPYKSVDVWKETSESYNLKFKAKRIVKGYGKTSDIEDAR